MSHFGEALTALMGMEEITQLDLAESTGISRSILSRFCNGHLAPTREMLARLVTAISDDRNRRLELLLAHARDEVEAGSIGAGIAPENYVIARAADDTGIVVPIHLQATFEVLVNEASRPDRSEAREVLDALAHMILAGKAEAADSRIRYPEPRLVEQQVAEETSSAKGQSAVSSAIKAVQQAAVHNQTPPRSGARKRG